MGAADKGINGIGVKELTRLFAAIVQQSNDAIIVADEHGTITQWNRAATELYGYTSSEALGRDLNFLSPDGVEVESADFTQAPGDGHTVDHFETVRERKDGRLVQVSVTISRIVTDAGQLLGTVALTRDISAMVRARDELKEVERRMNEAQALAHVGSWDWDLAVEFPSWTPELCRIYGYPPEHVPTMDDLLTRVHPDDREQLEENIESVKRGASNDVEYRIELPGGEVRHVHARHHSRVDQSGEPMGVHGVVQDVTDRRHYEDELERLATHDGLTGLPNRRTFDARLELELARAYRDGVVLSLAILDIDHFKRVNDTFGHPAGDRVLTKVGEIFAEEARTDELVARVGGEEFAWILHGASAEQALIAVERVRAHIAATDFGETGHITLSAGVCALAGNMEGAELYRGADLALLHAKRTGRDRVVLAEPSAGPPGGGPSASGPQATG
jgi:diguanylate cyclase (GGDEF)-like protein/PAS domain S-box-containing protein